MRITNGIMINNSLNNIRKNKTLSDKLNTQLATTKKIQRPSEDPIVAIRALRLRSTYNEIEQYLDKLGFSLIELIQLVHIHDPPDYANFIPIQSRPGALS